LFGAATSARGWDEIDPVFDRLEMQLSDCTSFDIDVLAAGVSGDLAYIAAIERTSASINGQPASYALRVTQIFGCEDGEWKVVHRHADRLEGTDVRRQLLEGDH
jgi:ketosteroid isomerase-like protein